MFVSGYLTVFILLFIYVVLNTLRAIVEEAFFASRSFRRSIQPFLRRSLVQRSLVQGERSDAAAFMKISATVKPSDTRGGVKPELSKGRSLRASSPPEVGTAFWGKICKLFG